jgi:hypothetical protein
MAIISVGVLQNIFFKQWAHVMCEDSQVANLQGRLETHPGVNIAVLSVKSVGQAEAGFLYYNRPLV